MKEKDVMLENDFDHKRKEFLSIVSHQLRTPLSTISWYAEALLASHLGPLLEGQSKYVMEIARMNARMIELVDSLLNVSRIDLGTFKVTAEPVCLSDIADAVLRELETSIRDRTIHVEKDYTACKNPITADPNILHIIFHNLLTNAVVYNKKDGSLTIRIITDEEVHITITDTGCGIPKHVQSNVFEKFFRADNAREVEPGGTGIGLYTVRALLHKIGGTIRFKSEEGRGSTFYVSLPISINDHSSQEVYEK